MSYMKGCTLECSSQSTCISSLSSEPKGGTHRVTGTVPSNHNRVVWVKAFIVWLSFATVPCVSQLSSPFRSLVQRRTSYLWKEVYIFEDKYKTSASPRLKNWCFPPIYSHILFEPWIYYHPEYEEWNRSVIMVCLCRVCARFDVITPAPFPV